MIHILDNALPDPASYRAAALAMEFRAYDFEQCTFLGIGSGECAAGLVDRLRTLFPALVPTLTFFRKSPLGQVEPHFIHTDIDMGQWSAILYLNENPPPGDGTSFWTHRQTEEIGSIVPHQRSEEGRTPSDHWELRITIPSRFNRLLIFPSFYFHSRALFENWGESESSRFTQVVFGTGKLI
jgi:hypothetical protein